MRHIIRPRDLISTAAVVAPLLIAAACGDSGKAGATADPKKAATVACRRLDTTALYLAYREYIKATVPTPQRFLSAAGTDSAAPEDGFRAMQDKGPSYFYGGDSAAKLKIRETLASVGPYASLLIVQRGMTTSAGGDSVTVKLGGHYIGGEHEGKPATSRNVVVVCADSSWKMASVAEEKTP